jgi:hypothetical protein
MECLSSSRFYVNGGGKRRAAGTSRGVIVKEPGGFCKPPDASSVEFPGRDIIRGK